MPNKQCNPNKYYTFMYSNIGSPTADISGIVHFRSKAFDKTILKICISYSLRGYTFWTLMEWLVEQKMRLAFIACANRRACCQWNQRVDTCFVISSWSSLGKLTRWSNFVPTKNGIAVYISLRSTGHTLLNPLACRYHSLMELRVDFRLKSNMNNIATASLHTRGNIFTNSRWPPKSHIENVISVFRILIVFSIKLTPDELGWCRVRELT
jgi:hypothetical protein